MIDITDKQSCCGCSSCVQKCPRQCISLHEDTEGFLYPVVDKGDCIDCGLCEKVCPLLHWGEALVPMEVLAVKNKNQEERIHSSSGGVFIALSRQIIMDGGVLFGMTTGMMAGGIGDLIRMSKSKKFVDKATKAIPQGQTAILGNIIETWEIPLNTTLKPFESQIQRISIDEALANFAEEEQQKINIDIDALQHKIKNSSEEEKDKLEYELSKLQVSSAILTKDIPMENSEDKYNKWIDNVKTNLIKLKDNISDYFEDDKEELLDEYHDVREDFRELKLKLNAALKRVDRADDQNFYSTMLYLRNEVNDFDEEISGLETEINKLDQADKDRWEEKLAKIVTDRNTLLDNAKLKLEAYSKNNHKYTNIINVVVSNGQNSYNLRIEPY
jgi:NAD-dependent dihydropyrimidine dehydrogenase PreA subunit